MRRMLISKPVGDAVLRVLETALSGDLFASASGPSSSETNVRVAGIINQLDREQIEEILQGISESEPMLAAQLKSLLFSFEDVVNLSQRARAILFDQVPTERVILALRGADAAIRDCVLPCLSNRTRRMVEAELASNASPPKRDIVAAQRQIAETVLRLADQGLIEISPSEENGDQTE
jgi:flagellar motor switch protein FliG